MSRYADALPGLRSATGALLVSVAVLALLLYAAYEMNTAFSTRARLLGNTIIVPALALAAAQVVRELRRARPMTVPPEASFTRSALIWSVAFFVSLWALGLSVTIPAFAFVYLRYAAGESFVKAAAYAVIAAVVVELLFGRILHVPLPAGAIRLPAITN